MDRREERERETRSGGKKGKEWRRDKERKNRGEVRGSKGK